MTTMIQREDDCILQQRQEGSTIGDNVGMLDISSSCDGEGEEVARIHARGDFDDDDDEFVRVEIECVEYSRDHSCGSVAKFVELHAEERACETR